MRPEDVHYIAVEGGGAGGLLVHPGVLEALERLQIVRQEQFKQTGILGWAGSSSGSVISTLVSCGYASWEIAALVSQEAFDMVFRLETIQQSEFATIAGKCKQVTGPPVPADLGWTAILAMAIQQADPLGALAEMAHKIHQSQLVFHAYLIKSPAIYQHFRTEQVTRLNEILVDARLKGIGRFRSLAEAVTAEHNQRLKKWPSPPADALALLEAEFPYLIPKLLKLFLVAHSNYSPNSPSLFEVLKLDYGLSSGCLWRDYIDHLIAFARFRVRFAADLPSLKLPRVEDMKTVTTLDALFQAAIIRAIEADYGTGTDEYEVPHDFLGVYDKELRHCTFKQHAAEFYDWLGSPLVPPLTISGANITTRESHLFSSETTPDFHIADAVRIATGLPPIFKPVIIEAADIPKTWPVKTDRFGSGHYLEGLWVDGGVYYNAPFEVFKDVSSSFTAERYTMGIGVGLEKRVTINNLTQYATAFINLAYEANVSASRINLEHYLNINRFGIGFATSKVAPKALEYYRLDANLRTFRFFGLESKW